MSKKKRSLEEYLGGLSGKSKLIMYLIATGSYTFEQIRTMTVEQLLTLRISVKQNYPDLLDTLDELTINRDPTEYAFLYASGRRYSVNNVRDILVRAHARCNEEYQGLAQFIISIK